MENLQFNPTSNRSAHLVKQLQQIEREIQSKRNQLEKKKLQEQFYEDREYVNNKRRNQQIRMDNYPTGNVQKQDNNLNLADQIMNELLIQNKSKRADQHNPARTNYPYQQQPGRQQDNIMYKNIKNFNVPSHGKDSQIDRKYDNYNSPSPRGVQKRVPIPQQGVNGNSNQQSGQYNNYNLQQQNPPPYQINKSQQKQSHFDPRQNNLMHQQQPNKRQLQKLKLQYPKNMDQNPFLPKAQPIKRSVQTREQKQIVNERQLQKLKLQQGSNQSNPFWGDKPAYRNKSAQRNLQQQNNNHSLDSRNTNNNNYQQPQFQNIHQMQKQKPQQQLHNNNDFDINRQNPNSPLGYQVQAQKDKALQNITKKAAFQNRYSNPFVRDEGQIKQKKQEQLRQYRRALEQQKKVQEQRKKQEKQMVKQQKYALNAYDPNKNASTSINRQQPTINSQNLTKKVDPNGPAPVYNNQASNKYTSSSDLQYMRMKANQLKDTYKRGRIHYDEYIAQAKKLAVFYKVDIRQLVNSKDLDVQQQQSLVRQGIKKQYEGNLANNYQNSLISAQLQQQQQTNRKYQIIQNQQSLQQIPQSQTALRNNNGYSQVLVHRYANENPSLGYNPYPSLSAHHQGQYGLTGQNNPNYLQNLSVNNMINPQQYSLGSTALMQQFPQMDYDLMRRMFDQLKSMRSDYTKSLQNEKMFLQQTFMKFVSNNMMQQQIQQNQYLSNNQEQIQQNHHLSNNQQQQNNARPSPKPKNKHQNHYQNILSQASDQNPTDQSTNYIQKSLSGVANKISFYRSNVNRNQASKNNGDPSFIGQSQGSNDKRGQLDQNQVQLKNGTLEHFFAKPYKTKCFKKFSIMVDITQSTLEVPNVSNFLALKNGKDVVNMLFEEDLVMMKKLQRQKDVQKLRNKVGNRLSYGTQQQNDPNQQNYQNSGGTRSKTAGEYIPGSNQLDGKSRPLENRYQEYQDYSRSKSNNKKGVKSTHQQNHRSYKKTTDESLPSSVLSGHKVSDSQDNLPNFSDQSDIKAKSPAYYSPKLNCQILQQDQYQTAQKSSGKGILESQFYGSSVSKKVISPQPRQIAIKMHHMKKKGFAYEQERQSGRKSVQKLQEFNSDKDRQRQKMLAQNAGIIGGGMFNFIQENNQALGKYGLATKDLNEYEPRQQQVEVGQQSSTNSKRQQQPQSGDHLSGVDHGQQYRETPMTANGSSNSNNNSSKGDSRHLSNKFNSQKHYEQDQGNQDYQQSLQTLRSIEESINFNNIYRPGQSENNLNEGCTNHQNVKDGWEESSGQDGQGSMMYSEASYRRPTGFINISQTVESYEQASSKLCRPPLNKNKISNRKKESSILRTKFQKDSILLKPPSSESQVNSMVDDSQYDVATGGQPLRFDSNVYDSEYQQSVDQRQLQKRIETLHKQSKMKISQPQILVNPPVILQSKSFFNSNQSRVSSVTSGKLKSLEEARNLVKKGKRQSINVTQSSQIFNYEQKMSQLQSFITKRDDSQTKDIRQVETTKLFIKESPQKNKKDIMNLLDQLQNQPSYKDDFETYRE